MSEVNARWSEPDPLHIDTGFSFLSYLRKELRRYRLPYSLKGIRKWYNKCACYHNQSSPGGDNSLIISIVLAQYFSENADFKTIELEAYMEDKKYNNAAKPDILIKNGKTKGVEILDAVEVESKKPTRSNVVRKMRLLRKHGVENVMFGIPYSEIGIKRSIEWLKDIDKRTGEPLVDSVYLVRLDYFEDFMKGKIRSEELVEEINLDIISEIEDKQKEIHVPQSRLKEVTTTGGSKTKIK